jgi:hypothetical protein
MTTFQVLDSRALGQAAAMAAAALFAICGLAVAVAPDATTAVAGYLVHADASALLPRAITPTSFVVGVVTWAGAAWLVAVSVGVLYNRTARSHG